jgi:hypothetical protein
MILSDDMLSVDIMLSSDNSMYFMANYNIVVFSWISY